MQVKTCVKTYSCATTFVYIPEPQHTDGASQSLINHLTLNMPKTKRLAPSQ
jgi:hypothetical protein